MFGFKPVVAVGASSSVPLFLGVKGWAESMKVTLTDGTTVTVTSAKIFPCSNVSEIRVVWSFWQYTENSTGLLALNVTRETSTVSNNSPYGESDHLFIQTYSITDKSKVAYISFGINIDSSVLEQLDVTYVSPEEDIEEEVEEEDDPEYP